MGYLKGRGKRVCVLMGGPPGEREVSLESARTVIEHLRHDFVIKPVQLVPDGGWVIPQGVIGDGLSADPGEWFQEPAVAAHSAIDKLLAAEIDVVFNALHGPLCEDGNIQGFFRWHGLPVTGPETIAAAVTMDKRLTKEVLRANAIRTPEYFTIYAPVGRADSIDWVDMARREATRMSLPWVLKPNRLGSSVGVSIVRSEQDFAQVAPAVVAAWPTSARTDDLLVECAVEGRELSCGVLQLEDKIQVLPPVEIRPLHSSFFDYRAKYTPGACDELCPAPISATETEAVQKVAAGVHKLFAAAPLSRTDLFLSPDGDLTVLEVNTLPGMTSTSLVPQSALEAGIDLADLFGGLIDHALRRAAMTLAVSSDKAPQSATNGRGGSTPPDPTRRKPGCKKTAPSLTQ